MSPRLPSGLLLALSIVAAAGTVLMADPASAGPSAHAASPGSLGSSGPSASTAKADKIRDSEWWLASMHVTQAWQFSRGSGVTVALLSTGVLSSHPDLTGSVTTGPDFTGSGETSASDTWGIEGTSAASIIAGHGDNTGDAAGIIGIAPAARILSVRVAFDAADSLNADPAAVGRLPDAIAQGIQYAVAQGAKVIDLPLDPSTLASDGAPTGGLAAAAGGSAAERSAVSYALSKGVVLVAPAGDNGDDGNTPSVPASYPGVIALGAVGRQGAQAVFSPRQSYVALTAPGTGITAASRPSGYRTMSTTDAASAMVAGITALIRSRYPALTSSQVRQALITGSVRSSSASGKEAGAGAGTADALKAMQAAAAIAAPQPSARPSSPAATSGAAAPIPVRPKPSTVGMAKSALRDAAVAAAGLIVVLLGVLLGLRLRRRRSRRPSPSVAEHRTLLDAPSGPPSGPLPVQAGSARHARSEPEFAFAPAAPAPAAAIGRGELFPATTPVTAPAVGLASGSRDIDRVPDSVSPRFAPPGVVPIEPGELADAAGQQAEPATPGGDQAARRGRARKGGRAGRSGGANPVSPHSLRRTATQSEVNPAGGPPWEPAPPPADELPHEPRSRPPDPFSRAARPSPVPPAPWDTSGPGPSTPPPGRPELPWRVPGPAGADPLEAGPTGGPAAGPAPGPAAAGRPPMAWRPVPPGGTPRPALPAPPAGISGPPAGHRAPPAGIPAAPPAGGRVSSGGSASPGSLGGPDLAGGPGQPRPISPRDRLPLEEPGLSGPAAPLPLPPAAGPPRPWRVPGSSGYFAGAGQGGQGAGSPEPGDPGDGYAGRTGRFSRRGEFLPPYAGRPAPGAEPEPGPAPAAPQAGEPAGGWTEESPSGPLYIWNPAALTEPFPASPAPGTPVTPPEADDDEGPHRHRA